MISDGLRKAPAQREGLFMPKKGRKPKERTLDRSAGVEPLRSQNIMIGGHRTSMRLEPSMWDALADIAAREGLTINDLCSRIKDRLDHQKHRDGNGSDKFEVTLTSAVRVFIAAYFRRACTPEGHRAAQHGFGNPFLGTPFDDPPGGEGDDGGASSGGGRGPYPGNKPPGLSGMPADS